MATIRNERDILLQATTPRLLSIPSNYITVIPSTTIFSSTGGATTPASISFQALFTGVLRGTVVWSTSPSVPLSTSGNSATLLGSNVPSGTTVTVTATLSYLGNNYVSSTVITHAEATPIYKIVTSTNNIINDGGVFTPSSVQFLARTMIGGELAVYNGRFIIDVSTDGTSYTTIHTSGSDVSSYTYTPNASHKLIRARMYKAGGTTILLDQITIGITNESDVDISNLLTKNTANILTGTIEPRDSGALKIGSISWNSTTGALVNGTGIALTEWGLIGASAGVPKFTIQSSTGDAVFAGSLNAATGSFTGNITGGANIDISGSGRFNGLTSNGGYSAAIQANPSLTQVYGAVGWGNNTASSAGVVGVAGNAVQATGVVGTASGSGRFGMWAINTTGTALLVNGALTQNNGATTLTSVAIQSGGLSISGNITQSSGTSQLRSLTINSGGLTVSSGTTSVGALSCSTFSTSSTSTVSNLSADMVDGWHANSFSRQFGTNSGTAIPSSGIIRILVSGITGVTSTGSSNIVSIESTSDIRLKTDIKDEIKGLDFIQTLKPVTYKWKDGRDKLTYHGFIAQDIENVDLSDNDSLRYINENTGYEGVDYISLVPILVKAIQELKQEVNELRNSNVKN